MSPRPAVLAFIAALVLMSVLSSAPANAKTSNAAMVPNADPEVVISLYVKNNTGFSLEYYYPFTNPGPNITWNDNDSVTFNFLSVDESAHMLWIDVDGDGKVSVNDVFSDYVTLNSPWTFQPQMPAGVYRYRDVANVTLWGQIIVKTPPPPPPPPVPWWHWDPFWIFGLFIEVAIIGWVLYIAINGIRFWRARKSVRHTDPLILKWLRAVMDPDGPTRPTESYVKNLRTEQKKARKARAKFKKDDGEHKPPEFPRDDNPGEGNDLL
jgi:hypothetical protein